MADAKVEVKVEKGTKAKEEPKVNASAQHFHAIAAKPAEAHVKDEKTGAGIPVTNKRAVTVAIYLALCNMVNIAPKACNASVIAMTSKLSTYLVGFSKIKGAELKGGEITSRGATGYASFVKEGYENGRRAEQVKKLLPGGDLHKRVEASATQAKLVIAMYGKVEGIDAMVAAVKAKA